MDPLPVKFIGDLRVIDDELEIVDFVPAREVCHVGHQVKGEPQEHAPHFPWAVSHCQAAGGSQEWSDTPNPMMGCVGVNMLDHPASSYIVADDS